MLGAKDITICCGIVNAVGMGYSGKGDSANLSVTDCIAENRVYGAATVKSDYTIPSGTEWTVPQDCTLTAAPGTTLTVAQGATLNYTVERDGTPLSPREKILSLVSGSQGEISLTVNADAPKYSGNYTGTVTFIIALEEVISE